MYTSETTIRVHYALTDQMGFVYYGRYAEFFEIGRVESLRQLGITYKEIEASGVIMPVTEMHVRFLRPARYDDLLTIVTTLRELPQHHKIVFYGEIFNEAKELLCSGHVSLYFINKADMTKASMPKVIKDQIAPFFQNT